MSDVAMRFGRWLGPGIRGNGAVEIVPPWARYASVETHSDPRAVLNDWRALADDTVVTPYQMPEWLIPWIDTVGASSGIVPMIAVARDDRGSPLALLPFGLARQGGLVVAEFLGARDSNFNMGLFRRGPIWTKAAVHDLLRRAAAASGRRVDLFSLRNQPHGWDGFSNPLLMLDHQPSPSFAYKATLSADPDAFFKAHLSRESRKKLRQKTTRLKGFGAIEVLRAETRGEVIAVLDALMSQRRARCEALGLPVDDLPALRRFLDRAAAPGAAPAVELYALRCGGRIVATLGGARRGGRFSGMLTSFAADPDLARASPGELLLADVMRQGCEAGLTTFDLGVGEARYKETYCPEAEPLFDCVVALTLPGHLVAMAESLRLRAKRSIKQSSWGWPLIQRLRRIRAGA